MRRRDLMVAAPLSLLAAGTSPAQAAKPKAGLSVAIAIGKDRGKSRSIQYTGEHSHFSVVLRNESEQPLRLWREWCSWGYFALRFMAIDQDGKEHKISKAPRRWSANNPDFEEIDPGECVVREVFFGKKDWEPFPRGKDRAGNLLQLQAIYEVELDKHATELGVWTGKIESPSLEVRFFGLS